MGTIGVYVDDEGPDAGLVDDFDDAMRAAWPEGKQYHRSAALRALMRVAGEMAPALVESGALPPDAEGIETAEDAERAVADALADVLAVGGAAAGELDRRSG